MFLLFNKVPQSSPSARVSISFEVSELAKVGSSLTKFSHIIRENQRRYIYLISTQMFVKAANGNWGAFCERTQNHRFYG